MNVKDDPFASVKLLDKELKKINFKTRNFTINDILYYCFEDPTGGVWLTRAACVSYPFTHSAVVNLSVRKDRAYAFLGFFGIKVPATYSIKQGEVFQEEIDSILAKHPRVIVKPADASLSRGLSLDLQTAEEVTAALEIAFGQSDKAHLALVQEQVDGQELRFVVANGKTEAVVLRESPRIIGDGVNTIQRLVATENKLRKNIKVPYLSYPQLNEDIINADFLSDSRVPEKGEIIELGLGAMIRTGASVYNVTNDVDASYFAMAESIVRLIGARFIVLDIFIKDYKTQKTDENYCFIEFNTAPELKLFYSCRDGKHFDVLSLLVPMIKKSVADPPLQS